MYRVSEKRRNGDREKPSKTMKSKKKLNNRL